MTTLKKNDLFENYENEFRRSIDNAKSKILLIELEDQSKFN